MLTQRKSLGSEWRYAPLVVLLQLGHDSQTNSAHRVSALSLPRIQDVCRRVSGLTLVPSITQLVCSSRLRLAGESVVVRRYSSTFITTHIHACPRGTVEKVLVVLTGNGNDILRRAPEGYQAVVSVTWSDDHTVPPTWLPDYLVAFSQHLRSVPDTRAVDLYGYSRGACALFHCCRDDVGRPEALVRAFDTIGFAGGCIWEKGNVPGTVIRETRAGIARMAEVARRWNKPQPFGFGVLSRADMQVEFSGHVANHQLHYRALAPEIHPFTGTLYVLDLADHKDVCHYGLRVFSSRAGGTPLQMYTDVSMHSF